MMQQTNLKDEHVMAAEWDKATALQVAYTCSFFLVKMAAWNVAHTSLVGMSTSELV